MQNLRALRRSGNALSGSCRRPIPTAETAQMQSLRPRSFAVASSPAQRTRTTPLTGTRSPAVSLVRRRCASTAEIPSGPLGKTGLYELHLAHGAKMVPFGGFHMPVQYSGLSVSQSHHFTRTQASIFDVGHMVQRLFKGPGAVAFLQRLMPGDLEGLGAHRSTLSVLLHADGSGGIVDDTVVTKLGDGTFYVVTNAACRDKDDQYFAQELEKWTSESSSDDAKSVTHEELSGWGLVALQGPGAEAILQTALAEAGNVDLKQLYFGSSVYANIKLAGAKTSESVLISRGGYTGEDGFEISIPAADTVAVTEALLAAGPEKVQLAGLGARDSLRLEAGMCLYGHDLDDTTTPVEGGLSWIIPKHRRTAEAGFYGAERISQQLVTRSKGGSGVERRRVGLVVEGAPAREGAEIVAADSDASLGRVTSGCPSPTLGKNIAMGYVKDGMHKAGTEVAVLVRGRKRKAVVTKMPFVPTQYWKGLA